VDLLNLGVPAELADQPLAAFGYVDVTGKPFQAEYHPYLFDQDGQAKPAFYAVRDALANARDAN
jgi:hypothetical protein